VGCTSFYFQIPQVAQGVAPGDLLQLFTTDFNTPSSTYTLEGGEGRILTLDHPIAGSPTWAFGAGINVPFARLHAGHVVDFVGFQAGLQAWLAQPEQTAAFFTEFFRHINPLLSNSSPTAVQVHDAVAQLQLLVSGLTVLQGVLQGYVVASESSVDALLRAFKEKGADRAIDLIKGGLFKEFFEVTPQTASYAGDFQQKMRAVVMNDLPVRKDNRADATTARLIASTATPDMEYSTADTEGQGVAPDAR
jgi:F0F1-type ATP synthase membrane subunit c/vacuolar-type H+-ATPase subunit K